MASYQNARMLCNGEVFPICPDWTCWEYDFMTGGSHLIFQKSGTYYLLHSGFSGLVVFYVHPDTGMLMNQMGATMWELADGSWTNEQGIDQDTELAPSSDFVWTDMDYLCYYAGVGVDSSTGITGSDPVLISSDNLTLEPLPSAYIEVSSYGATGIVVGAQVRDSTTGEVYDISDKAQYEPYSAGVAYIQIDSNRQVIIDESCTLRSIAIIITWDELPDQSATVGINLVTDSGGDSGGEEDDTGNGSGDGTDGDTELGGDNTGGEIVDGTVGGDSETDGDENIDIGGDSGEDAGDGSTDNTETEVKPSAAPLSLKYLMAGILSSFTGPQSPICTAHPITAYSYNSVILPKVPDTQSVGKMFAVIVGGADGKYHLYLSTEKLNVWTSEELAGDGGFVAATTYTFYMVYANYSLEDGTILNSWTNYETEVLPTVGTIEAGTVLEDQFVNDGILWSSYNLYGDDGELRKASSRIYPVTEV